MMRKNIVVIVCLVFLSSLSACQNKVVNNTTQVSITSSGNEIKFKSDIIKQVDGKNSEDIANTFKNLLGTQSEILLVKDD